MRPAHALGVLCFLAAPALALDMPLEFDITSGTMQITWGPPGIANPPTISSNVAGTFGLTVVSSDDHIGDSDSVRVAGVNLSNTDSMTTVLIGVATATFQPGSARFIDFLTSTPGHLDGGVANPVGSSYLETTILVVGEMHTTLTTWSPQKEPSSLTTVTLTSSVVGSENLTATLGFNYNWETNICRLAGTVALDFVVSVTGTAHVPEPALGGLVALGLGGAVTWLRGRRNLAR